MTLQKLALYISPFTMPLRQLVQKRESGMAIHVREEAAAGNIPNAKKSFPIKNLTLYRRGKGASKACWLELEERCIFGTPCIIHERPLGHTVGILTAPYPALQICFLL